MILCLVSLTSLKICGFDLMHESVSIAIEAALISSRINGLQMVKRLIWNFEGKDIYRPRFKEDYLHDRFVEWHVKEVFRI